MFTLGATSISFGAFSLVAVFVTVVTMGVVLAIALILTRVVPSVGSHGWRQLVDTKVKSGLVRNKAPLILSWERIARLDSGVRVDGIPRLGHVHVSRSLALGASDFRREYDGACVQMRMSYSACAQFLLFFVQWSDCHLAGALGLLRILIYKVYVDGTTTMSTHERKASIREFYGMVQLPFTLLYNLVVWARYAFWARGHVATNCRSKKKEEEEECGICMESNDKLVLPKCSHAMCSNCYDD
ncbi:zinc finger, RING/FYVE/PHD-type containing protein, partial [Tanacetum coccineum]